MTLPILNRSLVLEAPLKVADGAGGYTRAWEALGVVWAEVKAGSGREKAENAATLSRVSYRITVRATPYGAPSRPVPGQRFREGNRIFEIYAVAEDRAQANYLTCYVQEEIAP